MRMTQSKAKQADSKRLAQVFGLLSSEDKAALLAFAEFLLSRADDSSDAVEQGPLEPNRIEPKPGETVVAAIKRLSQSYHMLNRREMLNDTSVLMSAHVIQGRSKESVIDELETQFQRHYADYLKAFQR